MADITDEIERALLAWLKTTSFPSTAETFAAGFAAGAAQREVRARVTPGARVTAEATRQFMAAHPDMSQVKVARELGISPRTVRRHINVPAATTGWARLREAV